MSRRLLQLQELLGGSNAAPSSSSSTSSNSVFWSGASGGAGPDVSWMVVREPRLLTADFGQLMLRLIDMKVGVHTWDGSVGKSGAVVGECSPGVPFTIVLHQPSNLKVTFPPADMLRH